MANSCDFSTKLASTQAWLRTRGFIDDNSRILTSVTRFNEQVEDLTSLAKSKYGVDKGPLFSTVKIETAKLYNQPATRVDKDVVYKAIPNLSAFREIDRSSTTEVLNQFDSPTATSKASPTTLAKVKEFLERNGIDIKAMDGRYDANAAASLLENIIYVTEGKEGVALTEEAAHFAIEMIEQQNKPLFQAMLNKIGSYEIYKQVLEEYGADPNYQIAGKPNIRKLKKEAMGKVLAEYVIKGEEGKTEKPENIAQALTWWDRIKEWVKNILKIASFNPFEQAAQEFSTLEGTVNSDDVYFQLSDIQKKQRDSILNTADRVQKVVRDTKKEGTIDADDDDNNWYEAKQADGTWKRIIHRVTNRALAFKKRLFGDKQFTQEEKRFNNVLRRTGISGHSDMEDILNRRIDSTTGQKKTSPDPKPPVSKIDPNDRKLTAYNKLDAYMRDLIKSFPTGSIFIPEAIIYDEQYKGGEAGTVDLIVIEPDGKTHILDWKFINNKADDIAGWKQGAYDIQIGRYKQILRDRYGIRNFGMTRAIPILMEVKPYRTLTSTSWQLKGIAIGSADPKKIDQLNLLPVPTSSERTGVEVIDAQLDKLNALNKKLVDWRPKDEEESDIKRDVLGMIRGAIRALQTQQNVGPMVEGAENIYIPSADSTLESFKDFMKRPKDEPTNKEISDIAKEIDDTIRLASVYANMGDDFSAIVDDKDLRDKMQVISGKVRETQKQLIKARKELANKFIGERLDIPDIYEPETVVKGLAKIFSSSSQLPIRTVQALVKLYRQAAFNSQAKSLDFSKRVQAITDKIKDKKQVYDLLIKRDSNQRSLHKLIDEIDPAFGEKLRELSGESLIDFLKENIDYDAYLKETEAMMEEMFDTITGPNAENRKDALLAKYAPKHPLFKAKNMIIWKHLKKDKWLSKEYKALQANPEALELYNLARELGAKAAELGYIKYREQFNFLPFFQRGFLDRLINQGHISPVQDAIDGLATSQDIYGEVDALSGEKKYSIPKYGANDMSKEKTDEQGEVYRDYSAVSDDIGRILLGFSMEINRYEAIDAIVGQVEALRHIEEFKGHIRTNKFGIPMRDDSDELIVDATNEENTGIFEAIEQYLIYGNRYPLTTADTDTGFGKAAVTFKKFVNKVSNRISGKPLFKDEEGETDPSSLIKGMEALNRATQMKVLGLSPLASIANMAGLHIQSASQAGRFYSFSDWLASEKDILSLKFSSREEKELMAQLYDAFLPLLDDPNRHIWKKVGMNKIEGNTLQDFLFIGFQKPEFLAQSATFVSLLKNSVVRDGKIVPIVDAVRAEYPDTNEGYKQYVAEKDKKISEMKKGSIWNTKKLVDGKLEIPGFDMSNIEERKKLGLQSRTISRSISGNMSEEDVSRASMDIFFRSMMVFKNWIPKLVETRFGKLKNTNEYYDENSYDIGKVRLFWHVFMEHVNFRFGAIRNLLKANDAGVEELNKLYSHYKQDYEKRTGKEFTMSRAAFNDMVIRNIRNQTRELAFLFSMLAFMFAVGFMEPPEDKQAKAIFNTTKRAVQQIINELSFFYSPSSWEHLFTQGIFPAISTVTDIQKFINNLASEVTGMDYKSSTEGADEVREAAQPVKYLLKMVPGIRQGINYMAVFAPDMATEMDVSVPPAESF